MRILGITGPTSRADSVGGRIVELSPEEIEWLTNWSRYGEARGMPHDGLAPGMSIELRPIYDRAAAFGAVRDHLTSAQVRLAAIVDGLAAESSPPADDQGST